MGFICRRSPDPGGASCPGKQAWPELVGYRADLVAARIEEENRYVEVVFMHVKPTAAGLAGAGLADDYPSQVECCNRVILVVDKNNNVVNIPAIG